MSGEVAKELGPAMKFVYFICSIAFGFFICADFFAWAVDGVSRWLGITADLMEVHILVFIFAVGFAYLFIIKFASSLKVILTGTIIGIVARFLIDVIIEYQGWNFDVEFWNYLGGVM